MRFGLKSRDAPEYIHYSATYQQQNCIILKPYKYLSQPKQKICHLPVHRHNKKMPITKKPLLIQKSGQNRDEIKIQTTNKQKLNQNRDKHYLSSFLELCDKKNIQTANQSNKNTKANIIQNLSNNEYCQWQNYSKKSIQKKGINSQNPQILQPNNKQQLEEISLNNLKDPLTNIYLPIAVQIKLSNADKNIKDDKRKMQIKQKIKDRVKQQIHNIIHRKNAKTARNASTPKRSICFRPDILNQQILIKNTNDVDSFQKQEQNKQNKKANTLNQCSQKYKIKQSIMAELPFTSRKIRSSLDYRPEVRSNNLRVSKIKKRKSSHSEIQIKTEDLPQNYYNYSGYKRTNSTDIKTKRKKVISTFTTKNSPQKSSYNHIKQEHQIKPWVVSHIQDDQVHF